MRDGPGVFIGLHAGDVFQTQFDLGIQSHGFHLGHNLGIDAEGIKESRNQTHCALTGDLEADPGSDGIADSIHRQASSQATHDRCEQSDTRDDIRGHAVRSQDRFAIRERRCIDDWHDQAHALALRRDAHPGGHPQHCQELRDRARVRPVHGMPTRTKLLGELTDSIGSRFGDKRLGDEELPHQHRTVFAKVELSEHWAIGAGGGKPRNGHGHIDVMISRRMMQFPQDLEAIAQLIPRQTCQGSLHLRRPPRTRNGTGCRPLQSRSDRCARVALLDHGVDGVHRTQQTQYPLDRIHRKPDHGGDVDGGAIEGQSRHDRGGARIVHVQIHNRERGFHANVVADPAQVGEAREPHHHIGRHRFPHDRLLIRHKCRQRSASGIDGGGLISAIGGSVHHIGHASEDTAPARCHARWCVLGILAHGRLPGTALQRRSRPTVTGITSAMSTVSRYSRIAR